MPNHRAPVAASASFLRDLEDLASELARATDFGQPALRFQVLGAEPGFLDGSVPAASPVVDLVLSQLAQRFDPRRGQFAMGLAEDPPRPVWQWLHGPHRHEPSAIVHGLALVGRLLATVFYFEKHGIGLATLAPHDGIVVHHARFCGFALAPGATVSSRGGRA